MSVNNFESCLKIILREEGGNSDDPNDHGGRTSRGITQREWDAFRSSHSNRPSDVWQASDVDVAQIYHDQYWDPYCDSLHAGVDLVYFNMSVNAGRTQATKLLQRALGVNDDGMIGIVTNNALTNADPAQLVEEYSEQAEKFYRSLKQFNLYGKGWLARNARVTSDAASMVNEVPAPAHETVPTDDTPKANPSATITPATPENQIIEKGSAFLPALLTATLDWRVAGIFAMVALTGLGFYLWYKRKYYNG